MIRVLIILLVLDYSDSTYVTWDFNAAKNIKNRVSITVLCNSLLKQMDNGAYEPKKLKCEKVKEVLLSFRRNLRNVGSEHTECSHITFDYV